MRDELPFPGELPQGGFAFYEAHAVSPAAEAFFCHQRITEPLPHGADVLFAHGGVGIVTEGRGQGIGQMQAVPCEGDIGRHLVVARLHGGGAVEQAHARLFQHVREVLVFIEIDDAVARLGEGDVPPFHRTQKAAVAADEALRPAGAQLCGDALRLAKHGGGADIGVDEDDDFGHIVFLPQNIKRRRAARKAGGARRPAEQRQ